MALSIIPEVDLLEQIHGQDLLQLCQTNRYYRDLCRNDAIWEYKLTQEYPDYLDLKPDEMLFRRYYLLLLDSTPVMIASGDVIDYVPSRLMTYPWMWEYLYQRYHNFVGVMMKGNQIIDVILDDGTLPKEDGLEEENLHQADLILVLQQNRKPVSILGRHPRNITTINRSCYRSSKEDVHQHLVDRGIVFHPEIDDVLTRDDLCEIIGILRKIGLITK